VLFIVLFVIGAAMVVGAALTVSAALAVGVGGVLVLLAAVDLTRTSRQ